MQLNAVPKRTLKTTVATQLYEYGCRKSSNRCKTIQFVAIQIMLDMLVGYRVRKKSQYVLLFTHCFNDFGIQKSCLTARNRF
jgi:hypothetical protein